MTTQVVNSQATGAMARLHRAARKLSLRETAIKMGISAAYLSDLETGKRNWTEETVRKFNKATQ